AVFLAAQKPHVHRMNQRSHMLYSRIIRPSIEIQTSFDADQTSLAHVLTCNFCLTSPELNIEPIGFAFLGRTIHRQAESCLYASRLKVPHLGVPARTPDHNDRINHVA